MGVSLTPTATLPSPRRPWPTGAPGLCFFLSVHRSCRVLTRRTQTRRDRALRAAHVAFGTVVKPSLGALRALGVLNVQWDGPMSDPPHRCRGRHAAVLYFESRGGCRYVCGFTQSSGSGLCFLSCVGFARATSRDGAEGGRRESAGGTGPRDLVLLCPFFDEVPQLVASWAAGTRHPLLPGVAVRASGRQDLAAGVIGEN